MENQIELKDQEGIGASLGAGVCPGRPEIGQTAYGTAAMREGVQDGGDR